MPNLNDELNFRFVERQKVGQYCGEDESSIQYKEYEIRFRFW
jgi:hypothetical protein